MEKIIKFYCFIMICYMSLGCNNQNKQELRFISFNEKINPVKIKTTNINRGIVALNGKYLAYPHDLLYKDSFPKWIQDKNKPEFSVTNYIFKPRLTDIDPPFILYKNINESHFYVIKYDDTLKFILNEN